MKRKTILRSPYYRLLTSLSFRVYFICFAFLIIPLVFHSFFLYEKEYAQKLDTLLISLQVGGEIRVHYIEQEMEARTIFLELLSSYLSGGPPILNANGILEEWCKKGSFKRLFYYWLNENGTYTCYFSSTTESLEKECASLNPKNFEIDQVDYLFGDQGKIYVTVPISRRGGIGFPDFIVGEVSLDAVIQQIISVSIIPKTIFSIIQSGGNVVASSDKTMINEKIALGGAYQLVPLIRNIPKTLPSVFELVGKKEKMYAVQVPLKLLEGYLMISIPAKGLSFLQIQDFFFRVGSFLFFVLILGGGSAFLFIRRMSRPFQSLYQAMQKVAGGDLSARYERDSMGFEINILGSFFNQMIDSIFRNQREAEKQKLQKLKLIEELRIGHEIQKSMLPQTVPEFPGVDISSSYLPAKEVGGDFYDVFVNDKKELVFSIADTSGKGISACLYSLNIRSIFRSFFTLPLTLKEVVLRTNQLFSKDVADSGTFVTSWVGIYNEKSQVLQYGSFGHFPALLKKSNGEIVELNSKGIALGAMDQPPVEIREVSLEKEDVLLLYTDGVVEMTDREGTFYGIERLKRFLQRTSMMTSKEIIRELSYELQLFSEKEPQADDLTCLVLRFLSTE